VFTHTLTSFFSVCVCAVNLVDEAELRAGIPSKTATSSPRHTDRENALAVDELVRRMAMPSLRFTFDS
jgi:hypothetical protein